MAASHNDSWNLSTDVGFGHRVQAALLAACVSIANEGWSVPFHRERSQFASQVLGATAGQTGYVTLFANSVATDLIVLADATVNGTVALTSGNVATQAALVTDVHIDNAIASQFNFFFRVPQS